MVRRRWFTGFRRTCQSDYLVLFLWYVRVGIRKGHSGVFEALEFYFLFPLLILDHDVYDYAFLMMVSQYFFIAVIKYERNFCGAWGLGSEDYTLFSSHGS